MTLDNLTSYFSGRTLKVRLSGGSNINSQSNLGQLCGLALVSGFDWVYFESSNYIRISVIPDGKTISILFSLEYFTIVFISLVYMYSGSIAWILAIELETFMVLVSLARMGITNSCLQG